MRNLKMTLAMMFIPLCVPSMAGEIEDYLESYRKTGVAEFKIEKKY